MKKILAVLMSMIVIMGVCGVGTGCDPNKETEAEYKARIKKELDEIPVEATGYKLVDPTKQEVTYPEGEKPQGAYKTLIIDDHRYTFTYKPQNDFDDESLRQWWGKIIFSIDDGEEKPIMFSDNYFFDYYNDQLYVYYYEKKFFIVRYRTEAMLILNYDSFLPPILFYFDIEKSTAKYMGYLKEWFDYKIQDFNGNTRVNFTIVKDS